MRLTLALTLTLTLTLALILALTLTLTLTLTLILTLTLTLTPSPSLLQAPVVEGRELAAGGGTPLYASLAQLEGRSTSPVDDIESLWYCLAYPEPEP